MLEHLIPYSYPDLSTKNQFKSVRYDFEKPFPFLIISLD